MSILIERVKINREKRFLSFSCIKIGFPDSSKNSRISGYILGRKDIEQMQSVFYAFLHLNYHKLIIKTHD